MAVDLLKMGSRDQKKEIAYLEIYGKLTRVECLDRDAKRVIISYMGYVWSVKPAKLKLLSDYPGLDVLYSD